MLKHSSKGGQTWTQFGVPYPTVVNVTTAKYNEVMYRSNIDISSIDSPIQVWSCSNPYILAIKYMVQALQCVHTKAPVKLRIRVSHMREISVEYCALLKRSLTRCNRTNLSKRTIPRSCDSCVSFPSCPVAANMTA